MGLLLAVDDVAAPAWPAVLCAGGAGGDGRGYAWHDEPRRRPCFAGVEVPAPAAIVAAAIDGRELAGIDRCLAILALKDEGGVFSLRRLFPHTCRVCGEDHEKRAAAALRVVDPRARRDPYAHQGAIEALRHARVPDRFLFQPRLVRPLLSGRERSRVELERLDRYRAHLPVFIGDPERTRIAQIAYAQRYEDQRGRGKVRHA